MTPARGRAPNAGAGGAGAGPLAGRGAVVTGGGRGIGAAVAETLAGAGAAVVVAARTEDEVERVAGGLRGRGARAFAVACDVSHEGSVRRLGEAARRHLKTVDILVNSAGVGASAPLRKIALAEWDLVMAANATSAFLCCREFVPAMVERKWGRVVNLASIAGLEGAKYVSHYSASKHALVGFTRSVALEVAGSGVTVNAVCPAYVDTPMTEITVAEAESRTGLTREEALAKVLATTGQGRLIAPAEVAKLVLQLCGEEGGNVNGRSIVMNPGAAGTTPEVVNPQSLGAPKGFSHGILAPRKGRLLFVAGQAGWENDNPADPPGFAGQFARALDKVLAVVKEAEGVPTDVVRMTCFVTDLAAYRASLKSLAEVWRVRLGKHYPAMALVEVKGLLDRGAMVEIEATAVVTGSR
jgi:NAD(P)-dependent dehydrogenase (short-subunit alcohol dehydrogenase family)/enamine deaminase RidA (YjgF/YER057c/UK114 family)